MCDKCGKEFGQKNGMLKRERQVHARENKYTCYVYGEGFVFRNRWAEHWSVLRNVKPNKCDKRPSRFFATATLKKHVHLKHS